MGLLRSTRRGLGRLPLGGADLVLMAMHARWRGAGLANNTLLVVECDGPIAPDRVERALGRFLDVCPWPAARLRRPFPWGPLHWAAPPRPAEKVPPVTARVVAAPGALPGLLEAELGAAIDPRREPPLRFLTVDAGEVAGARRGFLVLTWFHPLMDPRGGQNLLAHLARLDEDPRALDGVSPQAFVASPDPRPLAERGRIARRSLEHMRQLAPRPPVSPGTGFVAPGRARFRQQAFVEGLEPAAAPRMTREIAWRLAVVGKAMAGLWGKRGLPDVPFLLPISVDLRPKGEAGATFGNRLAFHFARFRPSETADVAGLARALRQQMTEALRDGHIDANAIAMEFLRYRRVSTMLRALPWTAGGEIFSFNCADLGEFPPAPGTLFGRRVLNAYHVPVVPPRPGIGVFFNRCGDTSNLVVCWVEGAVSEDEAAGVAEVVREEMGWAPIG